MKILQVSPVYYPSVGGVEEHVKNIAESMVKKHDVSVFTTDSSGKLPKYEILNDVPVSRFKSWAPSEAYFFSTELRRNLSTTANKYDIVHSHSYHALPALYAAQAKDRNRLVFTPHYTGGGQTFFRNLLHIPYSVLGRTIFRRADKIICVSNYEKRLLADRFRVEENIVVIRNGVNLKEFESIEKRKKNCRTILVVARLQKYKGVQYLIMALPKLDKDIVLEIVGKGPYKESLVKLARKLGVYGRVRFYQDLQKRELMQKYVDSDLFALLSEYEACSIAVLEALASGTPCVLANTSGLREWVDYRNCFGIDYPINVQKLTKLINAGLGKKVKLTGRRRILDWSEVAKKLIEIYAELL